MPSLTLQSRRFYPHPPLVQAADTPPFRIAVVRFSALGDIVLVAAAVRALQAQLLNVHITWITSPLAYSLLQGMAGVTFVVRDKPRRLKDYLSFYREFRQQKFDVVLAMQANLRINLLYPALRAPLKIGFDKTRAREGQWLFCNRRIAFADTHLLDSFLAFVETLTGRVAQAVHGLPVAAEDLAWAQERLSALPRPWLAVHPVASKAERNWLPERYRAVIEHAVAQHHASIVLTGGNSAAEQAICAQLASSAPQQTLNLCGKTTPKQLAALLSLVDVLIAPDTGAVHIARSMNTPVVGLYAVASPKLTGPYQALDFCVDAYPQAVQKFLGKSVAQLAWNARVHEAKAMELIGLNEVQEKLDDCLKNRA
jgi:heptosyltransferase I